MLASVSYRLYKEGGMGQGSQDRAPRVPVEAAVLRFHLPHCPPLSLAFRVSATLLEGRFWPSPLLLLLHQ